MRSVHSNSKDKRSFDICFKNVTPRDASFIMQQANDTTTAIASILEQKRASDTGESVRITFPSVKDLQEFYWTTTLLAIAITFCRFEN